MGNFNNKLRDFMIGRNGPDKLANWSLGAALVVTLIGMFIPSIVLTLISYALLIYCFFRIFSTNTAARQRENARFEDFLAKFIPSARKENGRSSKQGPSQKTNNKTVSKKRATSKNKVTFTCDECGQSLSVPKGRGKLKVTCPKCHHQQNIDS